MIAIRVLREGAVIREVLFRSTPIRIGRSLAEFEAAIAAQPAVQS